MGGVTEEARRWVSFHNGFISINTQDSTIHQQRIHRVGSMTTTLCFY